jgi:hypothetical protein
MWNTQHNFTKRDIWALQTSLTPLLYVEMTVVIERRAVVCSKRDIWTLQTSLSPLLYVEVTVAIERRAVVCSKRDIWALQTSLSPLLYVEVTVVIERRAVVCVRMSMLSRYLRFTIEFWNCCDSDISLFYILFNTITPLIL